MLGSGISRSTEPSHRCMGEPVPLLVPHARSRNSSPRIKNSSMSLFPGLSPSHPIWLAARRTVVIHRFDPSSLPDAGHPTRALGLGS